MAILYSYKSKGYAKLKGNARHNVIDAELYLHVILNFAFECIKC